MKHLILSLCLIVFTPVSMALAPYLQGTKLSPADTTAQLAAVEKKLQAAGFTVVGRHAPKGIPQHGVIIVTSPEIIDAIRSIGGSAIAAAGIRVGVQADGTVSYINPDYWYRAFVRDKFPSAQPAVKAMQARLTQALGEGPAFGGDVPEGDLATYRYMFGMERFDSRFGELATYANFGEALAVVQSNLAKGVGDTSKVYEIVMPDRKIAVLGVAMNNADTGEGWWVNKIGPTNIAALPYEIFIVDNKVYSLYARFRIAIGWPALGMGQFMGIINAPQAIYNTMSRLAAKP